MLLCVDRAVGIDRMRLKGHRSVFDVLTNRYRLVTAVDFEKGIVWIKWIGTHKEYDKIDVKRVKHGKFRRLNSFSDCPV
jgi:mRNA-degrading endonuclease HigB of HigAB toxin-antitoxin module